MGLWYLLDSYSWGKSLLVPISWFMFELDNLLVKFFVFSLKAENDQFRILFQFNIMWKWPQQWSNCNSIYLKVAKMIIQSMWKRWLDWWSYCNSSMWEIVRVMIWLQFKSMCNTKFLGLCLKTLTRELYGCRFQINKDWRTKWRSYKVCSQG
jgi:hypothetical protein